MNIDEFSETITERRSADGRTLPASCLTIGAADGSRASSRIENYEGPWPARIWESYQSPAVHLIVASVDEAHDASRSLAAYGLYFNDNIPPSAS